MFSKLSFGQKLALWFGCAMLLIACSSIAIYFQLAKNGPPKDVERFINREVFYRRYYDDTDWQKEEERANGQIAANPKSKYWYAERGRIRWSRKNYKGAEKDYDTAYRLTPTDYESLANRGTMRSYLGNSKDGLADVNKAIARKPQSWMYADRAYIYIVQEKYDDALKDYDKCLETTDEKRRYHGEKAELYMTISRFDKAIDEYEKAVSFKKRSKDDDCFKQLVRLYITVGEIKKAQQACRRWLEEPEINGESFAIAADVSKALNDREEEIKICKQYVDFLGDKIGINPAEIKLYGERAEAYKRLGDNEKARSDFQQILDDYERRTKKDVYTPNQILKFGEIYELIGRKDKAQKLYETEIAKYRNQVKQYPKDAYGYLNRAELYAKLGNDKAALRDFETAKSLEDTSSIADAWSRFALKKGELDLAIMLQQEFLGEGDARSYAAMAEAWEAKGNHSAALGAANTALTLDRFLPDAYDWLGKARAAQGDIAESKRRLQQATALGYHRDRTTSESSIVD